jgi:hypothetical protein
MPIMCKAIVADLWRFSAIGITDWLILHGNMFAFAITPRYNRFNLKKRRRRDPR